MLKRPPVRTLFSLIASAAAFFSLEAAAKQFQLNADVEKLILSKNGSAIVAATRAIDVHTPGEFTARFLAGGPHRALGAGYYGSVFGDRGGIASKFSHAIAGALGLTEIFYPASTLTPEQVRALEPHWRGLRASPAFMAVDIPALRGLPDPPGIQPVFDELHGKAVWALYAPRPPLLPYNISDDGLAMQMAALKNPVTFADLLRSQRTDGRLHEGFDMPALWGKVVALQNIAEAMLKDIGMTVDLFQPANLMVIPTAEGPDFQLVDEALAMLTEEGRLHYAAQGIAIPDPHQHITSIRLVVWPAMPEHIVMNKLWGLTLEQAMDFMAARHGVDRAEALERIAALPRWGFGQYSMLQDYGVQDEAARLVKCTKPLRGPREPAP